MVNNSAKSKIPTRTILTKEDLQRFQESETCTKYVGFLTRLNTSILNQPLNATVEVRQPVTILISVLKTLLGYVELFPPQEVGLSRFGNPSFRLWLEKAQESIHELLEPLQLGEYEDEVATYLLSSFGDRTRIDYGTGHEANFMCFLYCLYEIQILQETDDQAVVLKVFWEYVNLMRSLQTVYWLEPAGSHGVWGLDDYQFLPFLFGSGQLFDHKYIRPKSIHDKEILEAFSKDYMYLSCISHINSIKTESLRWHSPMLDDISGVKTWKKVNEGMFKMYRGEVLNKLPIMQHYLFGSLIDFEGSATDKVVDELMHVHALGQEHPGCCSIRVPSSVAVKKTTRALPFD